MDNDESDDDLLERLAEQLEGHAGSSPDAGQRRVGKIFGSSSGGFDRRSSADSSSPGRAGGAAAVSTTSAPRSAPSAEVRSVDAGSRANSGCGKPASRERTLADPIFSASADDGDVKDQLQKMMQKIRELEEQLQQQQKSQACKSKSESPAAVMPSAHSGSRSVKIATQESSRLPPRDDLSGSSGCSSTAFSRRRIREATTDLFAPPGTDVEADPTSLLSAVSQRTTKKDLFGDDSASDEESEYRDKHELTIAGKEINRLLQAKGVVSSGVAPDPSQNRLRNAWTKSGLAATLPPSAAPGGTSNTSATETISSIRVVNCTVSSMRLKSLIGDRTVAKISTLSSQKPLPGEWVTVGVICRKTESKQTKDGKNFIIFKLTDLDDLDKEVTFFLFGGVYTAHWKLPIGQVIGLMAPQFLKSEDGGGTCITVRDPDQLLKIGTSKDFAFCSSMTKAGSKCSQYVNAARSDKCNAHVRQAYQNAAHRRPDLTASYSGSEPKAFQGKGLLRDKVLGKNDVVYYGGQTYTNSSQVGRKDKVTLQSLAQRQNVLGSSRVTSLTLHDILPEDVKALKEVREAKAAAATAAAAAATCAPAALPGATGDSGRKRALEDFIMMPSAGSMQFVAHLKKVHAEANLVENTDSSAKISTKVVVSAAEFLRDAAKKLRANVPSPAARKKGGLNGGSCAAGIASEQPTARTFSLPTLSPAISGNAAGSLTLTSATARPVLARGVAPGEDVCLDFPPITSAALLNYRAHDPKLAAIAAVRSSGGITPCDPNAMRKPLSDKTKESIRRRAIAAVQSLGGSGDGGSSVGSAGSKSGAAKSGVNCGSGDDDMGGSSAAKKARALLLSDEFVTLLNANSSHSAAAAAVEEEKLGQYFGLGEKKEKYEEQMQSTHKIRGVVFSCEQCKYTDWKLADRCKQDRHQFKRIETWKRFFKCTSCGHRCVTHLKLPVKPCVKCSGTSYAKAGMVREKKAALLENEKLALRGDEETYLGSLAYYQPLL